jgi:broad specificity phosphatase PhoE
MSQNGSPVTGIIEEELVVMDFGKYAGKTVEEVAKIDPGFYSRLGTEKDKGAFSIRRERDKTFRLYINPGSKLDH